MLANYCLCFLIVQRLKSIRIKLRKLHKDYSIEPLKTLSVLPAALADLSVIIFIRAEARLLAEHPAALVLAPIFPDEAALAVALIVLELADVGLAVGPHQVPLPVHLVVHPVAIIFFTVGPGVDASPLDFVQVKFTVVY